MHGQRLLDVDGRSLGIVRAVACASADPYCAQWALATHGPWRARWRLVPLEHAEFVPEGIQVPYRRSLVSAMPRATTRDLFDPRLQEQIGRRYGLGRAD